MDNSVFLCKCETYGDIDLNRAVDATLDYFGGIDQILSRGKNILIKPNLLMARAPETATTTNPDVVGAIASRFYEAGANVTIADSPGGPYTSGTLKKVYQMCGMDRAAQHSNTSLNYDTSSKKVHYNGILPRNFDIITPVLNADTIINISKPKTHMLTYYTGAVKNMFGTIAGLNKAAFHAKFPNADDFCTMLVDLCNYNAPTINICDAVTGMDGKGPSGGRARQVGVIGASKNPFAIDLALMNICGIDYTKSPVHKIAAYHGFVVKTADELEYFGEHIDPIAEKFIPAASVSVSIGLIRFMPKFLRAPLEKLFVKYPRFSNRCVGCADCARACPQGAIIVIKGKAVLQKSKCIKCYCCHELCPIKAVDL